ncbi:MAG: 2TM domain-containing protein [Candidatus Nanopelagicales bacterium]
MSSDQPVPPPPPPGGQPGNPQPTSEQQLRDEAIRRLKNKQNFWRMLGGFVILWVIMIAIWALAGGGYFWPMWVIFGTGIAAIYSGWAAFGPKSSINEAQIQQEMRKLSGP